jgi:LmbE family N-acetylglucosaminyl deacetylase/SAM-dependent methyltransferase
LVRFDAHGPGTTSDQWIRAGRLESLVALEIGAIGHLVVVAAHPDDETLGAGGLIAEMSRRRIPVTVIAVTDGALSNPGSSTTAKELAAIRSCEFHLAVAELAPSANVVEFEFPDGLGDQHRGDIAAALAQAVPRSAVIVAPWRGDGHRDHRIVGEACAELAVSRNVSLFEYPVWMWHWGSPDDNGIPWRDGRSLRLQRSAHTAKQLALERYGSQVVGLGSRPEDAPVLSPQFVSHFQRDCEVFFVTSPGQMAPKDESYFDRLYERSADPWRLSTRWYENRKRAISIASLPRQRYASTLEIGCSVGEFTVILAARSDSLLALDISQVAVDAASARAQDLPQVRVEHRDATHDFPDGRFDLIVLSEVGYYWDLQTMQSMVTRLVTHLADDGTVLACHWRHPVADYPLGGDQVHDIIRAGSGLHSTVAHREEDFVLEVFSRSSQSVATREGFMS